MSFIRLGKPGAYVASPMRLEGGTPIGQERERPKPLPRVWATFLGDPDGRQRADLPGATELINQLAPLRRPYSFPLRTSVRLRSQAHHRFVQ